VFSLRCENKDSDGNSRCPEPFTLERQHQPQEELEAWQLVKLTRRPGDRWGYYGTLGSIWDIFKVVTAERWRREVEPTLTMLQQALLDPMDD